MRLLWELLQPEIRELQFAFIPPRKAEILNVLLGLEDASADHYWEWQKLWGSFPSTREDSHEAVYCYALEMNTACIFHLMRAAEVGLRAFARRMKAKLPRGKPIEWGQWQEILKEIDGKNDLLARTMRAGPRKDDLMEFNRGVLGQFYGFKDEFRNYVMHKRKAYDATEAHKALERVHDFLVKLAEHTNEKGLIVRA